MNFRVFTRLLQIHRVLVKHGLDEFVRGTRFAGPLQIAYLASPAAWFQRKHPGSRGERLRLALQELGPIFMKFGQALSTRRDLLPTDIADELAKLQDRVPAFPAQQARELIEHALGQSVTTVFAQFESEPLAAATIAQVNTAQLKDGTDVVVKVVRPGIRGLIERDIEVLYALAELAIKYWSVGHKLKPVEVVREYHKTIIDELDLMREAANASQLRHNFQDSTLLYAPKVYFDLCRSNVMVMDLQRIQIGLLG
jgi:ubiquinone biosynthesis protein